ncbi:tetratricopeptide repeat protein [Azospirillum soli]|uniref:tetratricopeptide repeat protein n=1 Tax=Azospirillum soli TaxID=1304799 RepID=UPI001AE8A8C3|nr:SEL1-like repeat protein [Azospirillum soli]MBP2313196.1 TPR repeat protein [Azospirillum soli]
MRWGVHQAFALALSVAAGAASADDLSYRSFVGGKGDHPIGCLYAYAADKTGDHAAAVEILHRCVAKGNVWSMIWLAMLHENGQGVPKDLEASADLMRRGAHMNDDAGYAPLARYHWGVALVEGRGVAASEDEGLRWLRIAAAEGVRDAKDYLRARGEWHPSL